MEMKQNPCLEATTRSSQSRTETPCWSIELKKWIAGSNLYAAGGSTPLHFCHFSTAIVGRRVCPSSLPHNVSDPRTRLENPEIRSTATVWQLTECRTLNRIASNKSRCTVCGLQQVKLLSRMPKSVSSTQPPPVAKSLRTLCFLVCAT